MVRDIELTMPKVSFGARLPLKSLLDARGMRKAFDASQADFSDLATDRLYITDVLHKAYVRIDEEGTEAAAATGVIAGTTAAPSVELVIDRPFFLAIRDRTTGSILFMGRVVDPR